MFAQFIKCVPSFKTMTLAVAAVSAMTLTCAASARSITAEEARSLPFAEAADNLADSHPSAYYAFAKRLFDEGKRDDAVMWFYVGQLRFRFMLQANPCLAVDGAPALMASLNEVVGRPINQWAGGSPAQWAASIDKALAWDEVNVNAVTSKSENAQAHDRIRKALIGLLDKITANTDSIRRDREWATLL